MATTYTAPVKREPCPPSKQVKVKHSQKSQLMYTAGMAKRSTKLTQTYGSRHSHKTKKRLETKYEMLAEKASKGSKK